MSHAHLVSLLGVMLTVAACRGGTSASELLDSTAASPVTELHVQRVVRAGDTFELAIDGTRAIDQVTVDWNGRYYVPEVDPDGRPVLNDEGRPRYRDGIYANATVDGAAIGPAKFVDREEIDNWHDLSGVRGSKLRLRFSSAMASSEATVLVRRVFVRYKDPPGLKHLTFTYASGDAYLDPAAVTLPSGSAHGVRVGKEHRVYRVDVRWGDAKPRSASGVYQAGTAEARLEVNDVPVGGFRNVAALETQTWSGFSVPLTSFPRNQFAVRARSDAMRIHWIRLYYE